MKPKLAPLRRRLTEVAPVNVVVTEGGIAPAPKAGSPATMTLLEFLGKQYDALKATMHDLKQDPLFLTAAGGVVQVLVVRAGADPMMASVDRQPNFELIPLAWGEIFKYEDVITLVVKDPLSTFDTTEARAQLQQLLLVTELKRALEGGVTQLDTLSRQLEASLGPAAVEFFNQHRPLLENHALLRNNLPKLTALAVGAAQQAVVSRGKNARLRKNTATQVRDQIAAEPAPTPAPVLSPAPATPPVVKPAPAAARRSSSRKTSV